MGLLGHHKRVKGLVPVDFYIERLFRCSSKMLKLKSLNSVQLFVLLVYYCSKDVQ